MNAHYPAMNMRSGSPDKLPPPAGLPRRWLMPFGLRVAAMAALLATCGQAAPFEAPTIITQPSGQTITSGAKAALSVTASGNPAPTYQWYVGLQGNVSTPVSGATTNTFTTPPLTLSTGYWVRATNSQGTADSATATIHVTMEPATQAADGLTSSAAVLHGLVNPHDQALVYFEYGTTISYGNRTASQEVGGALAVSVTDTLVSLTSGTTYHFRLVGVSGGIMAYGDDLTFTIPAAPPVAVTGNPVAVSGSGATLTAAINPNGLPAQVRFLYGLTLLYGSSTPMRDIAAGASLVNEFEPITGLIPGATYHYCLIATTAAGITQGTDVSFVATTGGAETGLPTAAPTVTTGGTAAVTTNAAELLGAVNPFGGTTVARFEYGMTTSYGQSTAAQGVGNGSTQVALSLLAGGLQPGTHYHFRLLGSNSLGTVAGADAEFTTAAAAPTVVTGSATVTSTTSATVTGSVRARGLDALVFVDFGTNPATLSNSIAAVPATVTGDVTTAVSAILTGMLQGTTYYYQMRAVNAGGTTRGNLLSLDVGVFSGLARWFPDPVAATDRQGSVTVNLTPSGVASGWRFEGDRTWRASGSIASGLTAGARVIQYQTVPGYLPIPDETVTVTGSPPGIALARAYTVSGISGSGSLTVTLAPASLSGAQWRFAGESGTQWKNSEVTVTGLVPGDYGIECKAVAGRTTPPPATATVTDGQTTLATMIYMIAENVSATPPAVLTFDMISAAQDMPYAYVGQITSDAGSGTGFVVRSRVVATAGHVVFDDVTLAATTGLRWYFQRQQGVNEPVPMTPRGYCLMSGYADQRATENTPGSSSPLSQNLDAAALYFLADAGRGGYSGYFASDSTVNEFMVSSALKTLVGYPLDGIAVTNQGCMHATPPANVAFAPAFGQTYTTSDIRSSGGNSGGPLCVQHASGIYYPAAIYLGGSAQLVVRAIDSAVVALFQSAETSAGSGVGITQSDSTVIATTSLGALQVLIEPAAARAAGAGWHIEGQAAYLPSGSQINNLTPNNHTVSFAAVPGFIAPAPLAVTLRAGRLTTLTFTYQASAAPPVITSPAWVDGVHGQPLGYQISATNSPMSYTLQGTLPDGLVFHAGSGLIDGTPQVAGIFAVTVGAVNAGGAGTQVVTFRCLPGLPPQSVTFIVGQPVSYAIVSSETGDGVAYTAAGLPPGTSFDATVGVISGTPTAVGVFPVSVTVAKNGALAAATLTLAVVNPVPVFTLQPEAYKEVQYGMSTTLAALATISLTANTTLTYQWYEGASGDISRPVAGATSPTLTTPVITTTTMFWARASSDSGTSADSTNAAIAVQSSSNADLSKLTPSQGDLSPAFNPGIHDYTVNVPYSASISIKPEALVAQSSIMVNGIAVPSGSFSAPIPLTGISTLLDVAVTSGDGTMARHYSITVMRASPPTLLTTSAATNLTQFSATLNGSVIPNGTVSAFFQYVGPVDPSAKSTPVQILSGTTTVPVQAALSGLSDSGIYHYHLVVVSGTETFAGNDMTFAISKLPVVATGTPVVVVTSGNTPPYAVTLIGAVNPFGLSTDVHFEFKDNLMSGYVNTPNTNLSGATTVDVATDATSLINPAATRYYYRLVATNSAGTSVGNEVSFTLVTSGGTGAAPIAVTGPAAGITVSSAILQGLVNPNGKSTFAYFEYGLTLGYGSTTQRESKGNGSSMIGVTQSASALFPGTLYHYRCVAENGSAVSRGLDATFTTGNLPPLATTGTAEAINSTSVKVHGTVQARGATTAVTFEYGTDGVTFPYAATALESPVSGDIATPVSAVLTGLSGGTTYYFRVKAGNPGGVVYGTAVALQPNALLGYVQHFTAALAATDYQGEVQVILRPLGGGWRFVGETQWRASGTTAAGLTTGDRQIEFQPLAGLIQPPAETVGVVSGDPPVVLNRFYFDSAVVGDLKVILKPDAIAGGGVPEANRAQWRMVGDVSAAWRNSGDDITGIWPGSYVVECKGTAGFSTPAPVTVMVQAGKTSQATITYGDPGGNPPPALDYLTGTAGIGNLNVDLQPNAAVVGGAQWRLAGDASAAWRNSGENMSGMLPGSYLIECKDIPGRTTPTPMKVIVVAGQTTSTTITYFAAMETAASLQPVSFATASTSEGLPYAYVGLLRSGTGGSYTGFVVKPQVVATVAQAVFDEATLTATSDLQWLLQRDQTEFEPVPQVPRGFYAFTGYAAQRAAEGTPGTLTVQSQNLDVAALYFDQPAGRGGFSGFLATTTATATTNEYLQSSSAKTLVGYPLNGIPAANAGQMHTTTPVTASYTLAYGQTYTNPNIQGVEGMLGGPLCVQYGGGTYYPAGIFVGGATGNAVRAIDSETTAIFANAALSANGGGNNTGGGITHSSFSTIGSPSDPGAIKVTIEPAGARSAGAGWRLSPEVTYRSSGTQKNGLAAGYYVLQLRTVTGYQDPAPQSVQVIAGQLHEITYTYLEDYTPLELWRLAHFGTVSNTGNAADSADPDGDGCPNIHEFTTGTDPTAALEATRILSATKGVSTFTVTAAGKTTRTYVLERTADPNAGPWSDVGTTGPVGANGTVTLTDSSPPAGSAYYRIRVEMP